jgi:hypothetical protein
MRHGAGGSRTVRRSLADGIRLIGDYLPIMTSVVTMTVTESPGTSAAAPDRPPTSPSGLVNKVKVNLRAWVGDLGAATPPFHASGGWSDAVPARAGKVN